jgi:secondary thiamine-phosphate synthase enzyme
MAMAVKTIPVQIPMTGCTQLENITSTVRDAVRGAGLSAGIANVFIRHTTASVLIIEDEPGIRADTARIWERLIPIDPAWQHNTRNAGEDNGHSHLRAQLQGCSVTVPFANADLLLGRWQQIVVLDFDTRPRSREIIVQLLGE